MIKWLNHKNIPIKNLLIIGDGPQFRLINKLSKNTLNINVELTGWLTQKEQINILRKNDILIINSIIEGDPLVVSESLSRGIKCISRNIKSVKPILHEDYLFNSQKDLIKILNNMISENPDIYFSKNKLIRNNRNKQIKNIVSELNQI